MQEQMITDEKTPEASTEPASTAEVEHNPAAVAQSIAATQGDADTPEMVSGSEENALKAPPATQGDAADQPAHETPEEAAVADEPAAPANEVSELRRELDELRSRFEQQRRTMERMSRECEEFAELYPDRSLSSLPRDVWDNVRAGIPLAAACAYAEARREHAERLARQINDRNDGASSGDVSGRTADYFSPAEVRGMTPAEVRANYSKIMDSMRLWN